MALLSMFIVAAVVSALSIAVTRLGLSCLLALAGQTRRDRARRSAAPAGH